jgi:hypothetical protein
MELLAEQPLEPDVLALVTVLLKAVVCFVMGRPQLDAAAMFDLWVAQDQAVEVAMCI